MTWPAVLDISLEIFYPETFLSLKVPLKLQVMSRGEHRNL